MESYAMVDWVLLAATLIFMVFKTECKEYCGIKAIFNFGDSNTDTGGFWAAYPPQPPPYGMTYFNKPAGRQSDGRVLIDFLAEGLGLPFLSPYLQSIESDYSHGVNFATLASTVRNPQTSLFVSGISPFPLQTQFLQMKEFKVKVKELHNKGETNLPSPNIFGKSLYIFYIGQNDFTVDLGSIGISGVTEFLPQVVIQITYTIKEIYALGGRIIWVLNLAPIGCFPSSLVTLPHNSSDIDQFGCLISYNSAVRDYNNMLKEAVAQTRKEIADASVVYVDTHSVLLDLFQHPTSHGLKYRTKACCGYGGGDYNFNEQVLCGNTKLVNRRIVTAKACTDPQNYVSWDGIHTTDAANKLIANALLNNASTYFDPPNFSLHKFCNIQPIAID